MSRHPNATVQRAYGARYRACIRAGFSQADAREQATIEADRVAREIAAVRADAESASLDELLAAESILDGLDR